MAQFTEAITEAIAEAQAQLDAARRAGDLDDVMLHEGRLSELRRLAADHGLELGAA